MLRRITSIAAGAPAIGHAPLVTDVPDDGWAAAAAAAVRDVETAGPTRPCWTREMRLPFGTLPGRAALAIYVGEVSTHTWDLAVATGQSPAWDDELLAGALAAIHGKLPTAQPPPRRSRSPTPSRCPATPPLVDRLVAWQGRDPRVAVPGA